jgi:glycogen debranching enzyme
MAAPGDRGGMQDVEGSTWQQAEPVRHQAGLTVFRGSTFVLCDAAGELVAEPDGLFVADRRVLSRLVVGLDGWQVDVLRTRGDGESGAEVLRRAVDPAEPPGTAPLLVSTHLEVGPGELAVRLVLRNGSRLQRTVRLSLLAAADFADIFAVKEGRAAGLTHHEAELVGRRLLIRGSGTTTVLDLGNDPVDAVPSGFLDEVVLRPRSTYERTIVVTAHVEGDQLGDEVSAHARPLRRPRVSTRHEALRAALRTGADDLDALRVHDEETGGSTVAAGAPWFMTLFGRDALLTALMCAVWDQRVGLDVLRSLAARQGRTVDPLSEEEPGRILHETRMTTGTSLFEGDRGTYFGSTDSTPLFVVLLGELVRCGLDPLLAAPLVPAADACLDWLDTYGDIDGDGLVESVRRSDHGLLNQGWKDSWNAIVDADGDVVEPPVRLVEVQAYWYAALRARAELARTLGEGDGAELDARASDLQRRIDERFWLARLGSYALALGPDGAALPTSSSNAGHMLWTGCAVPQRAHRLGATLLGRPMRTHWGLRTLSADNPAYDPLGYHTGSVWPHDTALVAWGLSRYGLGRLGRELCAGLVRSADHFDGSLPELMAGFEVSDAIGGEEPVRFPTACSPQAWAAASPLLVLRTVLGIEPDIPGRRLLIDPHLPDDWLPLTLHGLSDGPLRRLVVRVGHDGPLVDGVPEDFEVVRGPRFR